MSRSAPYCYALHGLILRSEFALELREPAAAIRDADVTFRLADAAFTAAVENAIFAEDPNYWYLYGRLADGSDVLRFPSLFDCLVSHDGRSITCRFVEGATPAACEVYLLGQALSSAFIKQGIEPLHATTLVCDGVGLALLGRSGLGKSTLAAEFVRAGATLLTDDMLVLRESGRDFVAYPGVPRIKLFPDVAETLLGGIPAASTMNPNTSKLIIRLDDKGMSERPVPLQGFFVLDPSGFEYPIAVSPMSPRDSVLHLLTATFNRRLMTSARLKQQFATAKRWSARIPVWCVDYPRFLDRVDRVREAIQSTLLAVAPIA